jgi:PAS domain S-box-containing protein
MEMDLSRLVDALPGLVWTAFPDGRAEFVNRRWCEYTGLRLAAAIRRGWRSAIHPDDLALVLDRWRAFLDSGQAGEVEARLRRHDGEYRRFLISVSPISDEAGRVLHWCAIGADIEDRVRGETVAREHQRRFQRIVDGLPAIVALFAADGSIVFSNKQMLEYHDQTLEQLQQGPPGYTYHPDDRGEVLRRWRSSIRAESPFDCEARLLRADGAYRWHWVRGSPLRDAEGRVDLWYGLFTDIDDTKQAEIERARADAALKASEAELRQAYRHLTEAQRLSQTGSFTSDVVADDHNWSDEVYSIFEFDPGSKVSLRRILEVIHPEDRLQFEAGFSRAAAGGAAFDGGFRIITRSGRLKHLHSVSHLMERIEGRPVFVGAIQDVTEAKIGEEALKAREAELRRANQYLTVAQELSQTGSYAWVVPADDQTLSDEMYRILEFDPAVKVTHGMFLERIHPEDLPAFEETQRVALEAGEDFKVAYRIVTGSGAVKHLRSVSRRLAEVTDRLVYVGATQDVTEIRLAEEALNRVRNVLAHVTRVASLGALTASIAHEVNQPLAGIITNASTCLRMLAADPPNLEGARATAQRTIRDGNRASEVIQRLRGLFARKPPSMGPVDLNEAVREVLSLSSSELQHRGAVLCTDLAEDLPAVSGDRVQLQQVVLNLILNAADAMSGVDDRPRDLTVETARDEAGKITLSVRDAGVGIEPQNLERLFDAFYTTKAEGMGIGLSISRSIIQGHEGRLWASANDGPGATFSFSIPACPEPAPGRQDRSARTVEADFERGRRGGNE